MNKTILFLLIVVGLFLASCVPTKDLVYLQNKDNSEGDTVISQVASKPYRLQANDVVNITIKAIDQKLVAMFGNSETSVSAKSEVGLYFDGYTVDDHGNIRIPVLGELNVLGYTIDEVRKTVEKKLLEEYFNKEANIFVVVKLAGIRYTVNGEINLPGTKTLYQEKVTILEAIANSGDISITGNRKGVTVIRQFPHGTEMHEIDLTDVKAMQSPYYFIQPNDYIYIKPLKQKTWGTGTTGIQSLSSVIAIISLATTTFLLLNRY
ncbi:polysaccharide biosynthesis/export family protein [Flavobacterium psychrotolerans]|uniref:Sugar transporter n=1 Tax=Flavobacterium psychrotolerans TaxID=2169410 RepID=A0A2U1JJ14_9FLAO|nr:polysaccharide biosynthesis/export family protein [Flavobacterium psychrotolerans]PWA04878.1 sugar transporter [Flavobacterium psychrotolerans]